MANVKISELTAASAIVSGDIFEVSQGTGPYNSRKATGSQIQTFVLGGYTGASTISTVGSVTVGTWQSVLKDQSFQFFNSGASSTLDYANGSVQRWAPAGSVSLSVTNWPPSGGLGELLIEGINLGAATITWPTVNWIKSDGTTTTTFASAGVTLVSSGTDWVFLWTRDSGTSVYGKVVR